MVTTMNNISLSTIKTNNSQNSAFYKADTKVNNSMYTLSPNSSNRSGSPYTVSPATSPVSLQNDENGTTSKGMNLKLKNDTVVFDARRMVNNGSNGSSSNQNKVSTAYIRGVPVISLLIDGKERLCLAQISNTLLKHYSYNEIHNRRVALGINCIQCTPVQLEILRRTGAMPISSRRCGMITKREAERLVKSFLEDNKPPVLPDNFAFNVYHKCGWGCRGVFYPSRYNSSRAKCIRCFYCDLFYSPNKFIFHAHNTPDAKYIQPDTANFNSWRRHLTLLNPNNDDNLSNAWEDVKAIFNGGTRKRISSFNNSNSGLSSSSRSVSPAMDRGDSELDNILAVDNEKTSNDEIIETKAYSPTSRHTRDDKTGTPNSSMKEDNFKIANSSSIEIKNEGAKNKCDLDLLRKKLQSSSSTKFENGLLSLNSGTKSTSPTFFPYSEKISSSSKDQSKQYAGIVDITQPKQFPSFENFHQNYNYAIDSKSSKFQYKDLLNNSYLLGMQNIQASTSRYMSNNSKVDYKNNNIPSTQQTTKLLNEPITSNQLYPTAFSQFMAAAAVAQNYIPTLQLPPSNLKELNFPYPIGHQQQTADQQQHNLFSVWNHLNTIEHYKLQNRQLQTPIQDYLTNHHNLTNYESLFNKSYLPQLSLFPHPNLTSSPVKTPLTHDEKDDEDAKSLKRMRTSNSTLKLLSTLSEEAGTSNSKKHKLDESNSFENNINATATNYEDSDNNQTNVEHSKADQ